MSDVEDVMAAEAERRRALIAGDVPALQALFADDLVHVHTTGIVHDKAKIIHHTTNILRFHDIIRGPLNVRVHGDIAIMTGEMTNVAQPVGKDDILNIEAFVTQVWRREADGWKAISFHAVRKPAP
jgi:ketosteroid isomerase-like protein